jgi:hypothetical protein
MEVGPGRQVRDVVGGTRRQIVERVHLPALLEQRLGEVGADEAGSAGNERRPADHAGLRLDVSLRFLRLSQISLD